MKLDDLESNVADELLKRLDAALKPVCAIMDEAAGLGLLVQWDNIVIQPNGRHAPGNLRLVRIYKR